MKTITAFGTQVSVEPLNENLVKIRNYLENNGKLWCNEILCFDELLKEDQIDYLFQFVENDQLPELENAIVFMLKKYNYAQKTLDKFRKDFESDIITIINACNRISQYF